MGRKGEVSCVLSKYYTHGVKWCKEFASTLWIKGTMPQKLSMDLRTNFLYVVVGELGFKVKMQSPKTQVA